MNSRPEDPTPQAEDEVRQQSEKDFVPEGVLIAMDSLSGRKLADIIPSLNVGVDDALTPCRRLFVKYRDPRIAGRQHSRMDGKKVRDQQYRR